MTGRAAALAAVLALAAAGCAAGPAAPPGVADGWKARDERTLVPTEAAQPTSRNADGSVNVLIEIPAGTDAKWERRSEDGALIWKLVEGRPRVVAYLAYPGNYGMVPRTLLPLEEGGDGDPLDVLVLGPAVPRGAVVAVRLVGVLHTRDGGEQDDKLIGVLPGGAFGDVSDLADLDARFPGVTRIVELWFQNYKGPGVVETHGYGDARAATAILERAEASWPGR